ncbi:hypothetical protein KBB96_00265 [Luteolibacter ambystomatis]|uniref:Uncharacterized protein n=1 Tax=Luteolibacter ambystomatis TaxID=2824561 RepID=A0A975G9S6_9BACT|nr:hypothetical protein [Luteolibacter ambystomatis]QUE51350.1 hypothetical protein KBB96_00265 [Luteolibacter ambystomatis]
MMKAFAFFPLAALLLSAPLHAQNTDPSGETKGTETEGPRRFWQATLPGGSYMVALDRICSISEQTYIVDGGVVVHEVNIDTNGQALARFYYLEPPSTNTSTLNEAVDRAKQLLDEAGKRTGTDTQTMVLKKFPETTHAKCIEFRMTSREELDALIKSAKDAWESGKGRKFSVK